MAKIDPNIDAYELSQTGEEIQDILNEMSVLSETAETLTDNIDSHADTTATSSVLGHVKLSSSVSSTNSTSSGVAATPYAVKLAYDKANTANTAAETAQETAETVQTNLDSEIESREAADTALKALINNIEGVTEDEIFDILNETTYPSDIADWTINLSEVQDDTRTGVYYYFNSSTVDYINKYNETDGFFAINNDLDSDVDILYVNDEIYYSLIGTATTFESGNIYLCKCTTQTATGVDGQQGVIKIYTYCANDTDSSEIDAEGVSPVIETLSGEFEVDENLNLVYNSDALSENRLYLLKAHSWEDEVRDVADNHIIDMDGRYWKLWCPSAENGTAYFYNEKSYIFMLTGNADSENGQPVVYGKCIVLAEYADDATDGRLALYNSLKDEVSAREAADTALQESIDAEISTRETADTTLQENIDTLENKSMIVYDTIDWDEPAQGVYLVSDDSNIPTEAIGGKENGYYGYLIVLKNDRVTTEIFVPTTITAIDTSSGTVSLISSEVNAPEAFYIKHCDSMAGSTDSDWVKFTSGNILQSNIDSEIEARELESYYPEYHSDESTGNFYLDCANVDNAGTALFKATSRGVTEWVDLKSGKGFSITDDNIADDGIISTDGALTATLSSYAGFNTATSFTILFCAKIAQQSSNDDSTVLFQLGGNRVLQIHQKGQDGIRLVTYDEDTESHVYPTKLTEGDYTTGHYVIPLSAQGGSSDYGSYHHFAVVFDTSAETVTWYEDGYEYTSDTMEDTYVKVDGGYTATILENTGNGLRYFKIVRSAMTAAEVKAYMAAHPHTNYTNQPKTQYDNILLELERRIAALESA
ncbi:MAG: tail fiber protein [Oscillospiraceae bacterium]|nr:tail fiber protein [Oscillospiraceae bacterium]